MPRRRICVAQPPRSKRASTGSTHSHTLSFSGFLPGPASLVGVTNGSVTDAVAYGSALTVLPSGHEGRVAWSARAGKKWKAEIRLTAALHGEAGPSRTDVCYILSAGHEPVCARRRRASQRPSRSHARPEKISAPR